MQCHLEEDDAKILVADAYHRMGYHCNVNGIYPKRGWIFRRAILVSRVLGLLVLAATNMISLGVAESGLFPGVVYYLSMWYKRDERQYRISLFFSCASLAGAFGGILAYGMAPQRHT